MKAKKHYSAPTMEVVEANLECPVLAGSDANISNCQVECLQWDDLDESNAKSHADDDNRWNE